MTDRLDLPALGEFLRHSAPPIIVHDITAPARRGASHQLDATRWLERLADVLGCSPSWLVETGRVTIDDLDERAHIGRAARLIRSYGWETPPAPVQSRKAGRVMSDFPTSKQAPAFTHDGESQQPHQSAATASAAWRQARDQYHRHLFGCRACYAPTGRHCVAGAELRAVYDSTPLE
jgi:hypothetical protein